MNSTQTYNNMLNININGNNINIGITDIPAISYTSMGIFKKFRTGTFVRIDPLQAKATTLNSSIQKLHEAKSANTKNKILTTLRSALTVAVLVGGILGTIAMAWCPPAAIGIGIATCFAYSALCYYNGYHIERDFLWALNLPPLDALLGGPFFPLYEGFGKISKLENQVQTQKQDVETNFRDLVSFFTQDCSQFEQILTLEVEKLKASLNGLRQIPLRSAEVEKELQEKLEKHEKALSEFKKAKSFYGGFGIFLPKPMF